MAVMITNSNSQRFRTKINSLKRREDAWQLSASNAFHWICHNHQIRNYISVVLLAEHKKSSKGGQLSSVQTPCSDNSWFALCDLISCSSLLHATRVRHGATIQRLPMSCYSKWQSLVCKEVPFSWTQIGLELWFGTSYQSRLCWFG